MQEARSGRVPVAIILFAAVVLAAAAYAFWPTETAPSPSPKASPSPFAASPTPGVQPSESPSPEPEEGSSVRRVRWADVEIDAIPGTMEKLAKAGAGIYQQQCAVCHGAKGLGDGPGAPLLNWPPRNFTTGHFKFKTSAQGEMPFDDDLYRTITAGIPASGMPSFADLTPFERWALVAYVKSISAIQLPDGSPFNFFAKRPPSVRLPTPKPPPNTPQARRRGEEVYNTVAQCLKCHGTTGLGDGPSAPDLTDAQDNPILPANLTRGEVTFKTGHHPEDIFRVLQVGMAGTPMPSFASLGEEDLWNVAYFVTELYKPIDPGERIYLRVGCGSCHAVGKGKLIGPDLAGVTQRRQTEWLKKWLKDPPSMLATDPIARQLLEEYLTPMPSYGLTAKEIDLVIKYLESLPPAPSPTPSSSK